MLPSSMGPSNTPNPNHSNRLGVSDRDLLIDRSPDIAEQTLVHLKRFMQAMPDGLDKVEAYTELGVSLAVVGRVEEALRVHDFIDISSPRNNDEFAQGAHARIQIGGACAAALYGLGDNLRADEFIQNCYGQIRQLPDPTNDFPDQQSITNVESLAEMIRPFIALQIYEPTKRLEAQLRDSFDVEAPPSFISRYRLCQLWNNCEASFVINRDAEGLAAHLKRIERSPFVCDEELGRLHITLLDLAFETEKFDLAQEVLEQALKFNDIIENKKAKSEQFSEIVSTLFRHGQLDQARDALLYREGALSSKDERCFENNARLVAIFAVQENRNDAEQIANDYVLDCGLRAQSPAGAYARYELYWQAAKIAFEIEKDTAGDTLARKAIDYLLTNGINDGQLYQIENGLDVSRTDRDLVEIATDPGMLRQDRYHAYDLANILIMNNDAKTLALAVMAEKLALNYHTSSLVKAQKILEELSLTHPEDFNRPRDKSLGEELKIQADWLGRSCLANMRYAAVALELNDNDRLNEALGACFECFEAIEKVCADPRWTSADDRFSEAACHDNLAETASTLIDWAGQKKLSGFLDVVARRATTFFSPVYEAIDDENDNFGSGSHPVKSTDGEPGSKGASVAYGNSPWTDLPQGQLAREIRSAVAKIFMSTSQLHRDANDLVGPDEELLDLLL